MSAHPETHRRWIAQWRYAATGLDAVRRDELRRLGEDEARAAISDLLALADELPLAGRGSELVEQQRLLHARTS